MPLGAYLENKKMKYSKMMAMMVMVLAVALIAGCGGGTSSTSGTPASGGTPHASAATLTVKAVGPSVSPAAAARAMGKHAEAGIVYTSWDGSKAAYGVPVYVEATYTNPDPTKLAGVSVIIATDHSELYDSVTVTTDANGLAKTTLYAKVCTSTQVTVNVSANAPDEVLVASPAVITFMPSQLKLSSPALGTILNARDYPAGVDPGPNDLAITVIVGGYEAINGANARFPFISAATADGTPVADGLNYSISAMGLDAVTLQANEEEYATISPLNWPLLYTQPDAYYSVTHGGRIPQFTQITTQVPAPGTATTLEIIWSVTLTDPATGIVNVGYIAGTVKFTNNL